MKQIYALILVFLCCSAVAQSFDIEPIKVSGDPDTHINLIILSEGYVEADLDKFISDATHFSNTIFSQTPFLEYSAFFNVYAIKVPSNESGADHPGTATDVTEPASPTENVDTYFNTTFDSFGIHRLLFYGINGTEAFTNQNIIENVLADNFPTYDSALLLVNSNVYGGSGGKFPVASLAAGASEIAIHELGHSLFSLLDEFYPGDGRLREDINATQESDLELVRWKNWLNEEGVNLYPYGVAGEAATWFRPHENCKMRFLGRPFCAVCREGIVKKIHDLVSPIANFIPEGTTIENPEPPITFSLDLITPNPNTLDTVWTLNNVPFANGVEQITLNENELTESNNTITAIVTDNSPFLRLDSNETLHINTVTWHVSQQTLGINSVTNAYRFNISPNPVNTALTFTVESNTTKRLFVTVSSSDGKRLQTLELHNFSPTTLDTSRLKSGIYFVNFYDATTLLASKKFVKR